MFKINKFLPLLFIVILLLIIIPSSFAQDNDTAIAIDSNESTVTIESVDDGQILKATSKDYYFDASVDNDDGDGSIEYPYKYLTADRIKANANIYLANGEYNLDKSKTIEQVNFIGSDADKTIIKYDGVAFTAWNSLTLTNLTISDATIVNYKNMNATNTIFAHGNGNVPDSYGNTFGGAICAPYYTYEYEANIHIVNCTFIDNYAVYAGAIYMDGGNLDIIDTMFINNFAYNYGGAIAGEYGSKVSISKSKFYNSYSMADAGGAIYMRDSTLKLDNVEITNSTATFGGAITSLNTATSMNYLTVNDCSAKWDGGAVYHMYGNFSSTYGKFTNNSASNGGALFIDNSTSLFLRGNTFTNNNANFTAGAVYSLCNTLKGAPTVKYMNTFRNNKAVFKNDEYELSEVNLTIGNGNYTMYKNNESEPTRLPSYYSLRDYNLLTIPKDQQSSGNCWAFTAIAVLESNILKASGQYMDLSEENMKNVIAQFSDYGWDIETNDGGYAPMPIGYLVSWLGPVNETDDPFDDKGALSPVFNSLMHIQNVVYLKRDNFLDNDAIKKAIMQYGAVGTNMYYDNNFFRWEGYYCWYQTSSNHAVTIVGWDDNYSRDNFYGLPQTCGDGAWIVRNSWGPDWNDNGYFYVSYYDEKFAQPGSAEAAYTFILNDTIKYDKNYQYDIAGKTDYLYSDAETVWYKNIFNVEGDEYLAAVSTYFEEVTNWTVSVIVNGELKLTKQGTSNAGYYTIDLGQLISLKAGDIFEIMFNVSGKDKTAVPISEKVMLMKMLYKPGISFMSEDGIEWVDLFNYTSSYGTHTYSSGVACIKAFTILNEINTVTNLEISYDGSNPVNITATVIDEYGNLLNNGNITFNLNGQEFVVNVSRGIAEMTHIFDKRINSISSTFAAIGYASSDNSTIIEVDVAEPELIKTSLTGEDLVMSYKDGNSWAVRLTDIDGNAISNVYVKIGIKIGSKSVVYSRKTNGDGIASLPVNLASGSYMFNATFEGDEQYEYSFVNATVTVNKAISNLAGEDLVMSYKDGNSWTVRLTDDKGNSISGVSVKIGIKIGSNNVAYSRLTNADGIASLPINLAPGVYAFNATFDGNSMYDSSFVNATVTVNKATPILTSDDLVMSYKDGSVYSVKLTDENGVPLSGIVIKFTICSSNYNIKTDSEGIASLPINLLAGTYNITATVSDSKYDSIKVENTITVNKLEKSIVASDVNMTYKDGTAFCVQLVDNNGNNVSASNEVIKFTIKNVTYNIKTDSNGIAKLPINLLPGNYTIQSEYNGKILNNHIIVRNTV